MAIAGALGLSVAVALAFLLIKGQPAETVPAAPFARFSIVGPPGVAVQNVQVSPDGRKIAFVGADGTEADGRKLWVQTLQSGVAQPLPGTKGAANPFWAPNSQQLAFLGVGGLMKVDVGGGAPQTVCAALVGTGTWNRDGLILFQWRDLPQSRVV